MNHLNEEELILHYYGEKDAPADAGKHLAECTECSAQFAALAKVLLRVETEPVPERGPEYGAQVWQRIQGQVIAHEPQRGFAWGNLFGWRQLSAAGAVAVLVIAAFFAGRLTRGPEVAVNPASAEQVRERIMFVAVGEHLERSRMVLVELVNSSEPGMVDMTTTQTWAADLVESNRLYRQTATRAGETGLATVLEDLERVLLEVAHGPEEVSQGELELLRKRIEAKGILFKMRVLETQIQKRTEKTQPTAGASTTKS